MRSLTAGSALLLGLAMCHAQTSRRTGESRSSTSHKSHPVSRHYTSHHSTHRSRIERAAEKKRIRHRRRRRTANWRSHGQQKIDPQRVHDIQEALIREHYLTGDPSGSWDSSTQAAMKKFQADNGWQSTMIPDSRALIKLGLGPDRTHLLNPKTAMTSGSELPHASAPHTAETTTSAIASPVAPAAAPAPAQDPAPEEAQPKK